MIHHKKTVPIIAAQRNRKVQRIYNRSTQFFLEIYMQYQHEIHKQILSHLLPKSMCILHPKKRKKNPNHLCDCVLQSHKKMTLNWCLMSVFGWLKASRLACFFSHEITVHVLPEQYFSLTTISRNSIFQSCRTGPISIFYYFYFSLFFLSVGWLMWVSNVASLPQLLWDFLVIVVLVPYKA